MSWRASVLPTLSILALTFAAVLPWGLPSSYRFVLPLLPIVAIYYCALDAERWLPDWVVFVVGLTLDILTQGPLGYWALVYLIAYVVGVYASRVSADTAISRIAVLAASIIAVTIFAWLAASVYFLEVLDWVPYARGAIFALVLSVAVQFAFAMARPAPRASASLRLNRRS
jgi:rod shape-determining protein MreD